MRAYAWILFASCLTPHCRTEELFGELSSPGYPAPYPPSQDTTWTIAVPQGNRLRLQFTHFDVGEEDGYCQDYVKVIDGGQPLVTACGVLLSTPGDIPEPLEFLSSSNTLTVKFASRAVQRRHFHGFHAVYTAVAFDECAHSRMMCTHYCHSHPGGHFCSCAHGYTLGADQVSCQETGLLCSPEVPINATQEPRLESYKAGVEVKVTCQEGYEAVTQDKISRTSYQSTCQKDGQWSLYHHCQLKDCGPPKEIENSEVSYLSGTDVNTYGAIVQYNCTATYYKLTPKGDGVYRCSSDAHWKNGAGDRQVPQCMPVCGKPENPVTRAGRIIGGEKAQTGNFPWQVLLRTIGYGGGALIGEHWILTAAHVIYPKNHNKKDFGEIISDLEVYMGHIDVVEQIKLGHYEVENITVHPNYTMDEHDYDNDIALIKLKQRVTMNANIMPICLPQRDSETLYDPDRLGYASGFGVTEKNTIANQLRYVSLPVVSPETCREYLTGKTTGGKAPVFSDNMFCAGFPRGRKKNKDSCQGDDGGAFTIEDLETDRWMATGIISWGIDCGRGYGFYTKVINYVDWMEEVMKGQPPPPSSH